MFDTGFISKAPLFMDIVTIYFSSLPILLLISISFAKDKKYLHHIYLNMGILVFTIIMVVFFEVLIRLYGGFTVLLEHSNTSKTFFISILIPHIIVALISVISWIYLMSKTYLIYKKDGIDAIKKSNHKKIGIFVFVSMCITSYSGLLIYYLLFLN